MGRILLSNNIAWKKELSQKYDNAGFRVSGNFEDMIVYNKLNVSTENYLEVSAGEIVACNGTLVYKNKIGPDALRLLYSDYIECDGDIKKIRRNCFGSYFVAIRTHGQTVCFVDETGVYSMYYYSCNSQYLITNTYYHIESVLHNSINANSSLEEVFENCIYDNETPFNEVFRIMPEEVIYINNSSNTIKVLRCDVNCYLLKNTSFESVAEEIKDAIIRYTSKMALFSNEPVIFMTGGVDSRLSLATYLAAGIKPHVCSWYGNKYKMNTKDEDVSISKTIANELGLVFKEIDVCEDDCVSTQVTKDSFDKYGELAAIYGGNKKWFEIFERSNVHAYEFGYFGETIKAWELLDQDENNTISLDRFCQLYTNRQKLSFSSDSTFEKKEYDAKIHNKIRHMAESYGMNLDNLSKEDCMILYYRYRLHADTKCANLANVFGYCTPVLANKEIADLINQCPYVFKANDRINLYITQSIDKRLIDIPYFTHTKYMSLNKDKLILVDTEENRRKQSIIRIIKALGLYPVLKKFKSSLISEDKRRQALQSKLADEINSFSFFKNAGIILNDTSIQYLPLAISMLCHSLMISFASH